MKKTYLTGLYNILVSFFIAFPLVPKILLYPWLRIPFIKRRTPLVVQALAGADSFEMHEVSVRKGRISIGGVDETIWCSRIFHVLNRQLAAEIGEERKNRLICSTAKEMGHFEADAAIRSGKWVPRSFAPVFDSPDLLETVRNDRAFARLFEKTMAIVIRLIFNEGGWGNVKGFDLSRDPVIITMDHLQEPIHSGPSAVPVCHYIRGYLAGFLSRLLHCETEAEELSCAAQGGTECMFAVSIKKPADSEMPAGKRLIRS
ncbi:MAG: hypothetical protein JW874_13495 [Spirochaetales bacterium]|nr:hypothetical protein [Spirochaetales bacterium]